MNFVFEQCVHVFFWCLRELTNFALPNCLAWILFLVHTRLLHPSQNAGYDSLSKELAKHLYLSGRSMCRMKNVVSLDFVQNLCVCNLGSLKIHLFFFFLNERWYKLWLKIAINCFSNSRFTRKIIFALCVWHFKAGKVYKLKLFRYFSQWFYIS